jgi:heat shock protein HtpX
MSQGGGLGGGAGGEGGLQGQIPGEGPGQIPGMRPIFGHQGPPPQQPGPSRPTPHAVNLDAVAAQPDMRQRISAYPGNITYLDLIAKNKRQSTLLMVFMICLGMLLGAVLAAAVVAYGNGAAEALIPSAILGALAAGAVAVLGTLWSWYGGASAILAMSGARPIEKPQDPELFNVVEELSIAAGVPMPKVYLIDDSAMNAFATGRDPQHAAVAITRGLREKLTRDELQGVLAHEMSHVRHYDIRFSMLMATMVGLIVFACDAFWRIIRYSSWTGGGRRDSRDKEGGGAIILVLMILAVILSIIAPIIAHLIQMAYSRQREYLADAGAVELTRNPYGLAGALQKLAGDSDPLVDAANRGTAHLFIVNPLRKMAAQDVDTMLSSHPPIKDRIARLLALAR